MVIFKRIKDDMWQSSSENPIELAEASALFSGGQADPECYKKDEHGIFTGVVLLPCFATLVWDEVTLKGYTCPTR